MSQLLNLIRTSTPEERAAALAELVGQELGTAGSTPVAVRAADRTVGYLTPTVNAAATLPLPEFTVAELEELRRRAANPHESIPVDEFIRRFDEAAGEGTPR
jgi:hypothetical protein